MNPDKVWIMCRDIIALGLLTGMYLTLLNPPAVPENTSVIRCETYPGQGNTIHTRCVDQEENITVESLYE